MVPLVVATRPSFPPVHAHVPVADSHQLQKSNHASPLTPSTLGIYTLAPALTHTRRCTRPSLSLPQAAIATHDAPAVQAAVSAQKKVSVPSLADPVSWRVSEHPWDDSPEGN